MGSYGHAMNLDARGIRQELDLYFDRLDDGASKRQAAAAAEAVMVVVQDYEQRAAQFSREYMPEPRDAKLRALAKESRDRLAQATDKVLADLRLLEEDLRLSLAPKPPAGTTEQTLLLVERRAMLLELDPLDRESALTEAAETGDELTIVAAETAPAFKPIVAREFLRDLRERFNVKSNPGAAARLTEIRKIRVSLEGVLSSAKAVIPQSFEDALPTLVA